MIDNSEFFLFSIKKEIVQKKIKLLKCSVKYMYNMHKEYWNFLLFALIIGRVLRQQNV